MSSGNELPNSIQSIKYNPVFDKVLLFGDSITQRCYSLDEGKCENGDSFILGSALSDLFKRRMDVVHRGFSGYCSEHARYIVDDIIKAESNIKLVTIFFGSNDASKDISQKVPIPRFEENIAYIVKAFQKIGAKVIIIGPAPHDEVHRYQIFKGDPKNNPRSTLSNLEFSEAGKRVAKELDVPFIDLWHSFLYSVGWKEGDPIPGQLGSSSELTIRPLLNDGLHFTGDGYRILYSEISKTIQTVYPEFIPTNIPFLYPDFGGQLIKLQPSHAEEIFAKKSVPEA